MNITKCKEWMKEHKKELVVGTISMTVGVVGGVVLYKYNKKGVEEMHESAMSVIKAISPAVKGSSGAFCMEFGGEKKTMKDCSELITKFAECDFYDPDLEITGIAIFNK